MENVLNMCRYKRLLYTTALQTLPNAETLYYESPLNQSNKNYNGNISGMSSLVFNEKENIFHYKYDNLNRLTESIYAEINGDKDFSELFNYDKMGNITSLQRYGQSRIEFIYWMPPKPVTPVPVYEQIEDLDFAYSGNQVVSIQNNIESSSNVFRQPTSFKNYSDLGEEYRYDNNGNMIMDLNKNISTIRYNSLNLPTILQTKYGNTTEYLYSSSGMKLRTIHKTSRTDLMVPVGMIKPTDAFLLNVLTTDYIGNKIYENGKLKCVLTETGYIQDGNHYFYLKDHLGNNCVVVDESQNIIQHTTYYASGCFNTSQSTSQPYFYNGKEYDFMHGVDLYDYLARQFYSSIMRFTTPDPLAEKYYNISPYAYCLNNPIKNIDPDGRLVGTIIGTIVGGATGAYNAYTGGKDIWAGAAEGAVSGAITGATVDVAVAATVATGGGALVVIGVGVAAGAVGGAVGAVTGDVTGQVVTDVRKDIKLSDAVNNVSTDNFANKAASGAVSGAVSGLTGGALGAAGKAATVSTKAVQGTMSKNITNTATTLTSQGASQGTVNTAVSGITKGMGTAGSNTTNSMIKVEAAAATATESTIKVTEEQLKKK